MAPVLGVAFLDDGGGRLEEVEGQGVHGLEGVGKHGFEVVHGADPPPLVDVSVGVVSGEVEKMG